MLATIRNEHMDQRNPGTLVNPRLGAIFLNLNLRKDEPRGALASPMKGWRQEEISSRRRQHLWLLRSQELNFSN